ncbi:thiamine phosphate synthase [Leptospira semungkisensis]|uniref:Thiamine phosphate synthase n=1 Tax=Leptospira semungkisensis TaxID=2484985 RepID=A0A4R9FPQ0_9LEPT|nr:thiamine phosphate synthase [Leptospira semungkisensis]TGK00658.1 thiamine phosphate synthase [Leptospira semungkisensis]
MAFHQRKKHPEIWKAPALYPILDLEYCSKFEKNPRDLVELWNRNRTWIPFYQLRAKKEEISKIREIYKSLIQEFPDFPLILNDYWKEALEWGSFGLHIGKEDYQALSSSEKDRLRNSDLYLGTSCHTWKDVEELEPEFWDYTGLGPIYSTDSKQTEDHPVGQEGLKEALRYAKIPIVPIGGIGPKEIGELSVHGAFLYSMIAGASDKDRFGEVISVLKDLPVLS